MLSLLALLTSTLLSSFVLGAMQYFVMEQLTGIYGMDDRAWITQAVAATVTVGPAIIYFFSGALVSAMKKAYVMALSMAGVLLLLIGIFFSLKFEIIPALWVSLTVIGVIFGLYSAGKMSAIPFVQKNLRMSMAAVNGLMSMVFIFGLMPGAFCGTLMYQHCPNSWHYILGGVSIVTIFISLVCLPKGEDLTSYKETQRSILSGTKDVFAKHWTLLICGASLWGCANAVQMALNAYLTMNGYATIQQAATLPVAAAGGAVIGTLVSPVMNRARFIFISLFTVLMGTIIFLVPQICHSTSSVMICTVVMGIFFGAAVNLNDSTFLEISQKGNFVGIGASLQSALLALLSALISTLVFFLLQVAHVIDPNQSFTVFAICCAVIVFLSLVVGFKYGSRELNPAVAIMISGAKILMKLRYRATIEGLENIKSVKGALILPNHPAEMDPVLEVLTFWNAAHPRVVVIEDFYNMKGLQWLFRRLDAIPMPDIEGTVSAWKRRRVEKALDAVVEALKQGDNVLIYPGGALWRQDHEVIGAKSGLHYILSKVPEAPVVLAHAAGFWGSSFSYVYENRRPKLFDKLWHGVKVVLANLIFFVPKRPIEIKIEMAGEDLPRNCQDKMILNAWLQNWHDQFGREELKLYPFYFWSKKLPVMAEVKEKEKVDESTLNAKILKEVTSEIARMKKMAPEEISPGDRLTDDLGMDSLETAEVLGWLQDNYGVTDVAPQELVNIAAVAHFAASASQQVLPEQVALAPEEWRKGETRPCGLPEAETVIEAFLKALDRGGKLPMAADETFGILSYEKFKMAMIVFASLIKEMPGERIGIMLPSTVLCDILLYASMLAGKVPVMLNWTLGEANLKHVVAASDLEVILSAEAFVDKVENLPVELLEEKLVLVEDMKKRIGLSLKLKALRQKGYSAEKMLCAWGLENIGSDDTAVILFTSGSENVPKGVPLSNRNLLNNIQGVFVNAKIVASDVLYSFLPTFHSFGLTMTTLMPTICGIRIAHYPDPTAYRKLAYGSCKWSATVMGGTATFMKGIIRAGKPELFKTVRLVGVGGEKTPKELFDLFALRTPQINVIEGYGITECSPLVCLTTAGDEVVGVGRPIGGMEVKIVDLETHEDKPAETQGLIVVKGVSVFKGYLEGKPDPFITLGDNEKWYNTGDLGYFTKAGQLIITGREKRFVKIGGEMISLPALEAVLNHRWPSSDERPLIAVESREIEGERPELIIFSVLENLTAEDANEALKEAGIGNVARISSVINIPEMPLLGTGKTDYRSLKLKLKQSK